jgi:hypothetical protein
MSSWVDRELKKKQKAAAKARASGPISRSRAEVEGQRDPARMRALWERVLQANEALPPALQLRRQENPTGVAAEEGPPFELWLVAENDAALGFNGEAIRYEWPKFHPRKSNNFWIRWSAGRGYYVSRRAERLWTSAEWQERPFDESRIDYILKCLVRGVRVTLRSISVRRFPFVRLGRRHAARAARAAQS